MTSAQQERFRQLADNPKSWPAVRDHAHLCLTIAKRRQQRRAERVNELAFGIGFIAFLILLSMAAEVVR